MDASSRTNLGGPKPEDRERVDRTFTALRPRGVDPVFVPDRAAALAKVLDMLPKGGLVSHGTSATRCRTRNVVSPSLSHTRGVRRHA